MFTKSSEGLFKAHILSWWLSPRDWFTPEMIKPSLERAHVSMVVMKVRHVRILIRVLETLSRKPHIAIDLVRKILYNVFLVMLWFGQFQQFDVFSPIEELNLDKYSPKNNLKSSNGRTKTSFFSSEMFGIQECKLLMWIFPLLSYEILRQCCWCCCWWWWCCCWGQKSFDNPIRCFSCKSLKKLFQVDEEARVPESFDQQEKVLEISDQLL